MAIGKLLILLVVAMATTLVVATQAHPIELDVHQPACYRISLQPCVAHLRGNGPLHSCCFVLTALWTEECQCGAMESIANAYEDVDREYAKILPKKCETLDESCSFKMPMPYM